MGAVPSPPRLDPPVVAWRPEHGWVLTRAFGPTDLSAPSGEPGAVLALARALDLEGRLAARVSLQQLAGELGREAALALFARRALLEAQARARAGLLDELQHRAAAAGIPSAPLKGAALERRGLVPPGGRRAGDLDLLVPRREASRLAALLRGRGLRPTGHSGHAHQLPPLRTPEGHVLELHVSVPGVRPGADWDVLRAAGLLEPDPATGGPAHRPTPLLLAAHAVAHGLWQHALAPESYPPLRLLADLCDLSAAGLLPTGEDLAGLVEPAVSRARLAALLELVERLRQGTGLPPAPGLGETPARLLDHALAASLDRAYRRRLRRRERLSSLASPALPAALWRALVPSAAQLELRYGPAAGPLARAARRLRHPFDLLGRAVGLLRPRGGLA